MNVQSLSNVWLSCNSMDCSLPGFSVYRIFQARILERVTNSYSRRSQSSHQTTSLESPALAGRFFTPVPPRKPLKVSQSTFNIKCICIILNVYYQANFCQNLCKFIWLKGYSWHKLIWEVLSVQFLVTQSCDTLRPHGLQHARLPHPSSSSRACSNSCPRCWWCHPTISSSVVPLLLPPSILPSIRVFSNEPILCIRWPKYLSFRFSVSSSTEYSGLISFRIY